MYSLTKPTLPQIQRFIAWQQEMPFSYPETGASRDKLPVGYTVDHHRIRLGRGAATFARAKAALRRWAMFQLEWVQLCWPTTPLEVGCTVAVLIRGPAIWSLNACRIVYVLDEVAPLERFGFAYGTLPAHAGRGEERFSVEWRHADDSVWYDILAFSRPDHLLAKVGYPYMRYLQKRFAAGSKQAMLRIVD